MYKKKWIHKAVIYLVQAGIQKEKAVLEGSGPFETAFLFMSVSAH